ncbi:hypothetical protein [Nocardioides halotolerans]|uniref:hypothetical protein n=1 Tax=Nocardioides halotolerans TaxID=433660 RepID=UPI0003FE11F5|nr:hypothetical protein [Nocardioides halotolerans]
MLVLRAAAAAVVLSACVGALSACSDGDSTSDGSGSSDASASLPDNLCEPVLGAVTDEWQLTEDAHRTEGSTATCELTGPGDTSLRVTLTDFGDRDAAAAALDLVCRTAVGSQVGEAQRRCELASDRVAGEPFSAAYAASYAEDPSVVVVQLRTSDDTTALAAPAELASIEAALQDR